jgi:FTR1 family protein
MQEALTITLREGCGAFLIVGVMLAIFRRAGEPRLITATRYGIAASLLSTLVAGALFSGAENQALWEGVLALLSAVCVAWMAAHLWWTTRRGARVPQPGVLAWLATMSLTVLMITRGTMEIALLMGVLLWQVPAFDVIFGAAAGTAIAVTLAWLWARYGRGIRSPYFRHVTALFLCVLLLQLVVDGFHEITEANVMAGSDTLHRATEPFSTEGVYGQYASYLLVIVPLAWWLIALFWAYGKGAAGGIAHLGR